MLDLQPLIDENPGDQQSTVTVGWVLLTAHHRHAVSGRTFEQAFETTAEPARFSDAAIEHVTLIVVKVGLGGSAPELAP